MSLSIAILPTAVSLIAAQAIGFLWYHPSVWGTEWMAAMKESNPSFKPKEDPKTYFITAAMWLVSSVIYAQMVASLSKSNGLMDLVTLSLAVGLGFTAPPYILAVVFEQKNKTVALIGFGYIMTVLLAMAVCHAFL